MEGGGVTWTDSAISLAETLAAQVALIAFLFGIEQFRPARPQGISCLRLNIAYVAALRIIYAVLYPLSVGLTTLTVNALGGGLIELPASGAGLAVAIPCYALAMDGGEYLFHRAQHRIPLLWAMHSLHHSDPAVNVSTAPRHFWGEMLLKSVTIYALIGLLFKVNTAVVAAYTFFGLYNYVLHMNLRIGFGRWQPLLNSPQFHRLHHSALPEHHDCNFNQFFPVFDVLCGTYRQPRQDEYPPTGLVDGDVPLKLSNMLLWPWRRPRAVSMSTPNA
jgi:sterol desaturase/sphingolipid hydroxylase (fatty acid hydroxylase superfamily)